VVTFEEEGPKLDLSGLKEDVGLHYSAHYHKVLHDFLGWYFENPVAFVLSHLIWSVFECDFKLFA
jgi:hypothetical protein